MAAINETFVNVSTRLLVAATQAGSLIGKQGGTVKSIQEASNCIVRVLGAEDLPIFALQDDRVVEVVGEPVGVDKAVELIASHLRKFLVDRSVIPMFEVQMQAPNPQIEHMHPHQSWGPPQAYPPNGGGPGFAPNSQYMPPPRQHEGYYPPHDMAPPMDKQPHQGISAYGRDMPGGVHASSNAQPASSVLIQLTLTQIPLSYADAVIGNGGSNISYIRRASGATVTIQETKGVPGEMTVEINGSSSQVQAAQQLIQLTLTQHMQIPLSYADDVIGNGGSNISYIRRASGATVTIQETKGVPGEMTVEINGSSSQVQAAQQLIQNFMAEAAAATQGQMGGASDQGYNSYAAHSSVYSSPPSNAGHAAHAGGYGSVYVYGY